MNQFIPSIEPLPQPPVWQQMLLERPAAAAGLLVIAAILTVVVLNRREQFRRGLLIGSLLMVAAIVVFTVATLVQTNHEAVRRSTGQIIAAAASGQVAEADELLAEDAKLHLAGMGAFSLSRDELLAAIEMLDREVGVSDFGILDRTATVDSQNAARSRVVVRVNIREGGPTFSSWELSWRRDADGVWRVTRFQCDQVNGRDPGQWFAGELSRLVRR